MVASERALWAAVISQAVRDLEVWCAMLDSGKYESIYEMLKKKKAFVNAYEYFTAYRFLFSNGEIAHGLRAEEVIDYILGDHKRVRNILRKRLNSQGRGFAMIEAELER